MGNTFGDYLCQQIGIIAVYCRVELYIKSEAAIFENAVHRWCISPALDTSYHSLYRRGSNQDHGAMHRNDGNGANEELHRTGS